MTIFIDTQLCLDRRLNALGLSQPIAWDNVEFTPVEGTAWVRPTMIAGQSTLLDLSKNQANQGLYQIDIFYPVDTGPNALLSALSDVYKHFKESQTLTYRTATIYLRQISLSPVIRDGIWYTGSVSVSFTSYSN